MKRTIFLLILICALYGLLLAQNQISLSCSPAEVFVNSMSTGTFDPVNPMNQPVLTNILVSNQSNQALFYKINVRINWNDTEIVNTVLTAKYSLQPGQSLPLTNRDLVTNSESQYFNSPDPDVTLQNVLDSHPVLQTSLQAGYFPDGTLTFIFTAQSMAGDPISDSQPFIIRIKNINAVFLTYPGRPVGQNPPEVNIKPVTFIWNSVNTSVNKFRLVIKEFVPGNPPNSNSVESGGRKVFSEDLTNNIFTGFLPFEDKHYYAWQITIGLYDENEPSVVVGKDDMLLSNKVKSDWYVFKYASDMNDVNSSFQELTAIMNMLDNKEIKNQFANGFEVTGTVIYEGQVYTGKDAVDLAKTLIGKDIEVEIKDN